VTNAGVKGLGRASLVPRPSVN